MANGKHLIYTYPIYTWLAFVLTHAADYATAKDCLASVGQYMRESKYGKAQLWLHTLKNLPGQTSHH